MSCDHYSHSTDSNIEAQRGLDNLPEGFKLLGSLTAESALDLSCYIPKMGLKDPEVRGHRGHSSSLMRAVSPDSCFIFLPAHRITYTEIFSLCFFLLFTICVIVSIHLTSWLARDTVANETSLAQKLLSLHPTLPSWISPRAGPSSQTPTALPEVCIWLPPKSYHHFLQKTKRTPAPHLHSERPYDGKVTGDPGKPPARLQEDRRWGREPRRWAQNGHLGGFSLQELSAL